MSAAKQLRSDVARRRVLIADDDPLIRMDLAGMLTEEGFEVVGQIGDGQRAAAQARQLRPDLVIMDVKMPGQDGLQAGRRDRRRADRAGDHPDRVRRARPSSGRSTPAP